MKRILISVVLVILGLTVGCHPDPDPNNSLDDDGTVVATCESTGYGPLYKVTFTMNSPMTGGRVASTFSYHDGEVEYGHVAFAEGATTVVVWVKPGDVLNWYNTTTTSNKYRDALTGLVSAGGQPSLGSTSVDLPPCGVNQF